MEVKRFEELVDNRMIQIKKVLCEKGDEYSRNSDRLHNFKSAGRKRAKHPSQALMDMKAKHDVSVDDIVEDLSVGIVPSQEIVEEKIGDSIAYLHLLEGLIEEARDESDVAVKG